MQSTRHTGGAVLARASLLPVQRPVPRESESHNPVTGLSTPVRILCHLASGNRQP